MLDNQEQERAGNTSAVTRCVSRSSRTVAIGDQQQRLASVLDEYLQCLENGTPVNIQDLVDGHADLAEPLRDLLGGFDMLQTDILQLAPTRPSQELGRLGDYDILREVGRGGMGVVYEARQISLNRRVALKVLPFASMLDQRQIIRFHNEARAAAQLHHAHIVPVHGVGCERGVHYYAMQFIEGQSVRERIDGCLEQSHYEGSTTGNSSLGGSQANKKTIDQIARLGVQAANALHAAHECGIVHRDIKPSNLMVDGDGDLWITDFGLASCQSDCHVTQTGDVIGTLHYMSPEQARGDSLVDPRSDIYSLGVTLYEMLALRRPFEGETHAQILRQIELGQCKSIRHWQARVPRDLENVIIKAISSVPHERYQTARELEQDLRRFIDGKATHARPPSIVRRVSRWAARNRGFAASAAAALCVICLTFIAATAWLTAEQAQLHVQHKNVSRQLASAKSAFEEFGLATAERMKQIPGSNSARKTLLCDLLTHYENLLASTPDHPSLRADRAITSTKIAKVHRELGDHESAVNAYRAAQADFRHLAVLDASSRTVLSGSQLSHMAQFAKCLSSSGAVLCELGQLEDAFADASEAIRLQTQLAKSRDQIEDRIDLANSHVNLSAIEFQRTPDSACNSLFRAARIAEEALRMSHDEATRSDTLRTLSAVYQNLSARLQNKDRAEALRYGELAVKTARRNVELGKGQTSLHELLATNCNNLATLYANQQQLELAIPLYCEATLALRSVGLNNQLVVTLSNLAKSQNANGDATAAVSTYRDAIHVQTGLLMESPANLNHVSRLGGLHNNLAFVQQHNGQPTAACLTYETAMDYQRRAFELAPKQILTYRDALSRTYFNASRAELAARRPFRAAGIQRLRAELWPFDAAQLFSVASNLATALTHMPDDDPLRDEWKSVAATTLQRAISADQNKNLDPAMTSKLARLLNVQIQHHGLAAVDLQDGSRTP